MELDKQTIKKIIGLISFAILLSWGLKNTEFIKRLIALALGLLQPFLIGGVIAFVRGDNATPSSWRATQAWRATTKSCG